MGRGVKRVVEAEKGREKERVEKKGLAMATWREGGRERKKQELESRKGGSLKREKGGAKQPLL